jgi:V/A-type H+-transporting ATPase subunit E
VSLDRLLEKIQEDARLEGKRIVSEAREEAERIREEGREEARRAAEVILSSYRERAERERTRIMSEALAESRAAFLSTQEKLYNDVFATALKEAGELPEERYRAWLKKTILGNAAGGEVILAAPYDRRLLEDGLLDEINQALRDDGREGSMTLASEEAGFERGVILKSENVENNLSLKTILRDTRDRHEEELLRILFGEMDVRGGAHGQSG